jgi:hypothetical protein
MLSGWRQNTSDEKLEDISGINAHKDFPEGLRERRLRNNCKRKSCGGDPNTLAKSNHQMVRLRFFVWPPTSSMAHSKSIMSSWIPCTPRRNPFCSNDSQELLASTVVSPEAMELEKSL